MKAGKSWEWFEAVVISTLAVLMVTWTGLMLNAAFQSQLLV